MKNISLEMLAVISYISFAVGLAISSVGEVPEIHDAYSWVLPFQMFFLLAIPCYLSYKAGENSND